MRVWLLLILLVCIGSAFYLGLGNSSYNQKTAELVAELENL